VESRFDLFQDSVSVCARLVHGLCKRTIGSESFWTHSMVLLRDEAQVEAHFHPFGDSANLEER
jgi:hypothetical protein